MPRRRIRARQLLFTAVVLGLALWLLVPGGALVRANGAGPVYLPVVYRQPTPTPDPGWRFEYFNNPGLTAPVVYTTYEMSQFVEKATVDAANRRKAQQEFIARGRASLAKARKTGELYAADDVLQAMRDRLNARVAVLKKESRTKPKHA